MNAKIIKTEGGYGVEVNGQVVIRDETMGVCDSVVYGRVGSEGWEVRESLQVERWKWTDYPESEHGCHAELHLAEFEVGEEDSVLYHGADWPMKEEHKAMIAAAPELLAVLNTILDVWDEHKIIGPTVYHDARAIIAKAEGRD